MGALLRSPSPPQHHHPYTLPSSPLISSPRCPSPHPADHTPTPAAFNPAAGIAYARLALHIEPHLWFNFSWDLVLVLSLRPALRTSSKAGAGAGAATAARPRAAAGAARAMGAAPGAPGTAGTAGAQQGGRAQQQQQQLLICRQECLVSPGSLLRPLPVLGWLYEAVVPRLVGCGISISWAAVAWGWRQALQAYSAAVVAAGGDAGPPPGAHSKLAP